MGNTRKRDTFTCAARRREEKGKGSCPGRAGAPPAPIDARKLQTASYKHNSRLKTHSRLKKCPRTSPPTSIYLSVIIFLISDESAALISIEINCKSTRLSPGHSIQLTRLKIQLFDSHFSITRHPIIISFTHNCKKHNGSRFHKAITNFSRVSSRTRRLASRDCRLRSSSLIKRRIRETQLKKSVSLNAPTRPRDSQDLPFSIIDTCSYARRATPYVIRHSHKPQPLAYSQRVQSPN